MIKKPVLAQDFSKDLPQAYNDGRLNAPAYHRNQAFIREVVKTELKGLQGAGLEIGSGTGQHILGFAEDHPDIIWWPTDLNDNHLMSIEAWRRASGLHNIHPPVKIDASNSDWYLGGSSRPPADKLAAVICLNVIHIAPWVVAEGLIKGAARYLGPDGKLILYGPFKRGGGHTADSNERFDKTLRARNPEWGVRDMDDLQHCATGVGLALVTVADMPADNFTLVFGRG